MKGYIVRDPVIVNGKRYRRGDQLSGSDAAAVDESPIISARCIAVNLPDPQPDHGASALPGAAPAPKGDSK